MPENNPDLMHVFTLQNNIIAQYESFLSSFIRIKNEAIRWQVEKAMKEGKLLPEPLLQFRSSRGLCLADAED